MKTMTFLSNFLMKTELELFFLLSSAMSVLGLLVFSSNRKHLLAVLLSVEFIMLSLFWFISLMLMDFFSVGFISLIFLTFVVCEASLGLALLVCLIRSHGVDFFDTMNILKC
ncbi:NADH dehydrogenase subunit 4L (mitochondrion) [Priapulus caudatus]|uniref:NADH-ubiquinone oxidoreductase chain 4L n=1 Tax=Priapulus caudatus TaxID=37621 RepID=A0MCU2_PRICU|nr:NADH dehydrogenase subunit 4L [Priapulus caudatus]ABE03637.1 NADH dehydrogenase subunit 4L [Priapulus caudatus]